MFANLASYRIQVGVLPVGSACGPSDHHGKCVDSATGKVILMNGPRNVKDTVRCASAEWVVSLSEGVYVKSTWTGVSL